MKVKYLRPDWKIVTPRRRTRLEQGDQFADATAKRINAQEALLIAKQNGLNRQHKVEQTVNMYAMLCVGANAVAQLREFANTATELRGVLDGSLLQADIFSEDSTESFKRVLESLVHFNRPFQLFQPFEPLVIQQTSFETKKYGYGKRIATGRGFLTKAREIRGRKAFNQNFTSQ
ncbi:MAG: hypothetical protein EZS28_000700 [Streblomastix strix]|uniref:Uncharacterized protein n=1 Tax=Streblomastix strix TaxID=222440 RepID=A0A5J4X9L2_9EUKA|nr:MAG: hypothetical protein EZS28_000694 [Streblomastix strix]KAA6403779.1 MAG: hypothetical protein EZS28_000700 [Streblomastix strix]